MNSLACSLLAASLLLAGNQAHAVAQPEEASIRFSAKDLPLVGVSFGLNAVDGRVLLLGQRTSAHVASGLRTITYSCPNEPQLSGGSRMSFDFEPGQDYELVCRSGQQALIRPAEGC